MSQTACLSWRRMNECMATPMSRSMPPSAECMNLRCCPIRAVEDTASGIMDLGCIATLALVTLRLYSPYMCVRVNARDMNYKTAVYCANMHSCVYTCTISWGYGGCHGAQRDAFGGKKRSNEAQMALYSPPYLRVRMNPSDVKQLFNVFLLKLSVWGCPGGVTELNVTRLGAKRGQMMPK